MSVLSGGARANLSPKALAFLEKAIQFSWHVANEVDLKHQFFKGAPLKASSTLILQDILKRTEWGAHPLAQEKYLGTLKDANNLLLMENDSAWTNKTVKHEGKVYKSFPNWSALSTHISDLIVFRPSYQDQYLLSTRVYTKDILKYGLEEFEYWQSHPRK